MSGFAEEDELAMGDRHAGPRDGAGLIIAMRGQDDVMTREDALSQERDLSPQDFFGRAADHSDFAADSQFPPPSQQRSRHRNLPDRYGCDRSHVRRCGKGVTLCRGAVGEAGQGVIFGEEGDARSVAGFDYRGEGGGDVARGRGAPKIRAFRGSPTAVASL